MKKLKAIGWVLAIAILLVACEASNNNPVREDTKVSEEHKEPEQEPKQKEQKQEEKLVFEEQRYEKEANLFSPILQEVKYPKERWGTFEGDDYILKNGIDKVNIKTLKDTIRAKADRAEPLSPLELSFMTESVIKISFNNVPEGNTYALYSPGIKKIGFRNSNTGDVNQALCLFEADMLFDEEVYDGSNPSGYETLRFEVPDYLESDFMIFGDSSSSVEASFVKYFPEARIYVINKAFRGFRFFNYDGKYLGSATNNIYWWVYYNMEIKNGILFQSIGGVDSSELKDSDRYQGINYNGTNAIPGDNGYNLTRIFESQSKGRGYFVYQSERHKNDGIDKR